jgi:hypothetical protein
VSVADHRHYRDVARDLVGPAPYDRDWLGGQSRAYGVDVQEVARLYGAAKDGCQECRQALLEELGTDPATVAALVFWACSRVMDTFNDLPEPMLERGDWGFCQLVRAYSNSTFRHGFGARELSDLFEISSRMDQPALHGAAQRALDVLVADLGDSEVFGALADGEDGQAAADRGQLYDTTVAFTGSEVTITMAPRSA